MKGKIILIVVACTAALATTPASAFWARTWDSVAGYTSPQPARQDTDLWIGVTGQWPTESAFLPDTIMLTVSGNTIFLDIYDYYGMEYALPGPSTFNLGGDIGPLEPGYYDLYIAQYSNAWLLPTVEFDYVRGDEYLMTFTVYWAGDINADGYVNVGDLQALVAAWGSSAQPTTPTWNPDADTNSDGYINVGDLQLLVANWGRSL